MLFARLEINDFGYLTAEYMGAAQYEGKAYEVGKMTLVRLWIKDQIAMKKVKLVERLKLFHGNGHQRAPISTLIFSTKPVIKAILDPFVVQIISEEMLTYNPRVVAWLKVGRQEKDFTPMLIVREGTDLKLVDEFLQRAAAENITTIHPMLSTERFI